MRRILGTAWLGLTLASAVAFAQEAKPQTRQGFWIGFGLGVGSLGCEDCDDDDRLNGGTAYFKLGGSVSQHVLLGAEITSWAKRENDATLSLTNLSGVVYVYPWARGGFHLKGGVGLAGIRFDSGFLDADETGGGALLGIGYDGRVGRNFSLTPFINLTSGRFDSGFNVNTFQIGLGATWH